MDKNKIAPIGIFAVFFCLYGYTTTAFLPPYRDAGEMVILLTTLGVAHPPGYPLYTLLGSLFSYLPLGNFIFRVNMFSAFCGALTIVFLFLLLRKWHSILVSVFASSFFGFSVPFWELSVVPEMYSLGVLWIVLILYSCFVLEKPILTALLMTLGLGIRMDMMLLFPVLVVWFGSVMKFKNWSLFSLFFLMGLGVFLYMPIRSLQQPLLDWANPDSLGSLFRSVSRKSYGGTLDLLSLNYVKGENFMAGIFHFLGHLTSSMGIWIWPFLACGGWALYRHGKSLFLFFLTLFVISGPFYLFLANMPPNPHALAVLEAAYPVPDLILTIVLAFGLTFLMQTSISRKIFCVLIPLFLMINVSHGFARSNKRWNSYTRDYAANVFRCTPPGAILVFHEDVQLFTLWHDQVMSRRRKDVSLISTGLSASPWYWDMMKRWGTPSFPPRSLKKNEGFLNMKKDIGQRPLVVGQETSVDPISGLQIKPHGFLVEILETGQVSGRDTSFLLDHLCIYRGTYQYDGDIEFFSSDLVSDYARAYTRWGLDDLKQNNYKRAEWNFRRAETIDPTFARPTVHRGYLRFVKGDFDGALQEYERAIRKQTHMLTLSKNYKSLPSLVRGIKKEISDTYTNAGAAAEKKKDLTKARQYYEKATVFGPNAQAFYNLAVSYWDRDWNKVVGYLKQALEIDPHMAAAKKYLPQALYRQQRGKS
ncbi:hypothetical protein BVX98_04810 [bacterium F11]|nr:hypothetical protein BVX98_04810 [bacterium F11]